MAPNSTREFTNLAAGDHSVVVYKTNVTGTCEESVPVTVPDLGSACGHVSGTVYVDNFGDCIMQANEVRVPSRILQFDPGPYFATSSSTGSYHINLPLGTYSITQVTDELAQSCPAPVADITVTGAHLLNLGTTALVQADAGVSLSQGFARPGFATNFPITVLNQTLATTGSQTVNMTYDPVLSYVSANPAPSSINGNTLTWNFAQALGAFQGRTIHVTLQVPADDGLIGTVLVSTVDLTIGAADADLTDNNATVLRTVTAGFDPNDKLAATSSGSSTEFYLIDQDEWIDYTIRFQNTGTDTAFTVVITDTLTSILDPATIQWGAASHAHLREV
jgi:hypothetical protein